MSARIRAYPPGPSGIAETQSTADPPRAIVAHCVIVATGLLVIALVWAWTWVVIERDQERTVRDATSASANLARVFEEHAVRTLRSADQLLLHEVREYERLGTRFDLARFFREWQIDREYVVNSVISDQRGITVLSSTDAATPVDLSDREHVKVHANADSGALFISKPVLARVNRHWSLVLTRRINGPEGVYLGVAGLAIDPMYFVNFYGQVKLGPGGNASLIGTDGVIRARWMDGVGAFGTQIQGGEAFKRLQSAAEGSNFAVAATDGVRRLFSYRKVRGYPLIVSVGLAEDAVLADHRERRAGNLYNAAVTSLIVLLAMLGLAFYVRRESIAVGRVRAANAFLDSIVENAPLMLYVKEAGSLRFIRFNKACEALTGLGRDEVLGRGACDLLPRAAAAAADAQDRAVLEGGVLVEIPEERLVRRDNSVRYLHTHKLPVFDERGAVRYLLGISKDITHRREQDARLLALNESLELQARELSQANKEMEAFAYSVSHDLRAPVRHIDSFVTILQEQFGAQFDPAASGHLQRISHAALRMGMVIDDLLHYSRTGRVEVMLAEIDLGKLVEEIINELRAAGPARAIRWNVGPLPPVMGDARLLRLAFENLIGNAHKYTGTRETALIEIACERIESGAAVIVVRDNGVGFNQDYAGNLFGMFQRLHRQEEFAGTGIGLANVKRAVMRLGGRVWAEGTVDGGAAFFVALPIARRPASP
jgi:PAS domain S-box-containing protein